MDAIALHTSRSAVALREHRLRTAVDAHYDVVWRFLRRMGVREEAAEDAVQQVLLVLVRRLDEVEPEAERSFLLGTAYRVAADFRKQRGRLREVVDEAAVGAEPSDTVAADVELDRRRSRQVLDKTLERMPDDQRTVFVMCELEELTMSEVAQALGIAPGTVASRLRRARETFGELATAMRTQLGMEGDP